MRRRARAVLFGALALGLSALGVIFWRAHPILREPPADGLKLIDDFDKGQETNLIGGERFAQAGGGSRLTSSSLRIPTPSNPDGMVCALSYVLGPGGGASWGEDLNELDISAATALRFWFKASRPALPQLRVELVDVSGGKALVLLGPLKTPTRWQRITIPVTQFRGVDFNRLSRFVVRLSALGEPLEGAVYLDDLAFLGPPDVFFRSLQDNLYGFPQRAHLDPSRLLEMASEPMLRAIAGDTWGYFRDLVDARHELPLNYVQMAPTSAIGDYASTTDIAMYLMSVVSALDLDLLDHPAAVGRVRRTLETLERLPAWRGFFYNYYSTTNLQITSRYISSVDNGWLAAALVVVRQAFPELAKMASALLNRMDFAVFHDPQNGQLRLGYEAEKDRFAPYHYGLLATEARIISAVAIGKGDLAEDHWFDVYRTLPKEWTWQRQAPRGGYRKYRGHDVFQGYYTYQLDTREVPFVPSWGGSLFEFLMPTLVLDERRLAPGGLGLNDQRAVEMHIDYALRQRGFPVWGLSPCATPRGRHGGYSEFGVPELGAKGYPDEAIVTPHVSLLALPFAPEAAQENLRQFLRLYRMYGPYGLYDAVDVATGDVAYRYLALDQGMSLIALNNYLNEGAIQRRFGADAVMKRLEPLLRAEQFFESDKPASAK